ncbi:unnamed protein product, partial [Iphiclides podalirius]
MEDLKHSIIQYNEQLQLVNNALAIAQDDIERESLLALQSDVQQLIQLTQDSLDAKQNDANERSSRNFGSNDTSQLDQEYALFMQEMSETEAHNTEINASNSRSVKDEGQIQSEDENSDIEDELASLLGMKCAVYHTHKWGGQPSLHNAMVSSIEPRQNDDQFNDLQVRVLFTHPTHAEMLPCPYFLDGECKFTDDQCRYSHGSVVKLSILKEAIEPNFEAIKVGSRILFKLKPPDNENVNLVKKSIEKYNLWHLAVVKSVDFETKTCIVKLEHGLSSGEKRKIVAEEFYLSFEEIFPLSSENTEDYKSDDSLSDTEYPESKSCHLDGDSEKCDLLVEKIPQNSGPAIGEWERHTRGIGSKLMLSMGYVPGTGLGAAGDGRIQPVEAQVLPVGRGLDHCMDISRRLASKDPIKVGQKLKRLQRREEDRNKRAYEREKERERRNVFNFLNRTLGDTNINPESSSGSQTTDYKQSILWSCAESITCARNG